MRSMFDKDCEGFLIGMGIGLFLFVKHGVSSFIGFNKDHYSSSDF